MVSLRLARGDLKFRVNVKNDDSKCAFKHMVHVDAQCNLSCSCARQKQDRTSPQRKHLHAKKNKNLRCLMFFFVCFFCRVSANESCFISCDIVLVSSKYDHRCVFHIINNGHTLVTQDYSMTVGGTSLSFSGQVIKRVFLLGWKQLKIVLWRKYDYR